MRRVLLPFLLLLTLAALIFPAPGSASSLNLLPTATFYPSPTPARPNYPLSTYRLKPASAVLAQQIAGALNDARIYGRKEEQPAWLAAHQYAIKDYDFAQITMLQEAVLRLGSTPDGTALMSKLAALQVSRRAAMTYSAAGLPFEPLQTLLQDALNKGAADPVKLGDWLKANNIALDVSLVQPVDNLFGDNKRDMIYLIGGDSYGWLFALRGETTSGYKIIPVADDWLNLWKNTWKLDLVDLTGDGVPELVLQRIFDNGTPDAFSCWQKLMVFSWTADGFRQISAGAGDLGESSSSFACLGYHIDAAQAAGAVIEAVIGGPVGCEDPNHDYDFTRRIAYRWNQTHFERTGERIQPLAKTDNAACAALWAYEAGPEEPTALPLMEKALQSWPEEINRKFGPAAQDYFRYKLGIWYAILGQRDQALTTLAQVRDAPASPEFKALPAIAGRYLSEYQAGSAFTACQSALTAFQPQVTSLNAAMDSAQGVTNLAVLSKMQSTWGFADPVWGRTGDPTTALDGREEETALCSTTAAFRTALRQSKPQTSAQLAGFLYHSKVQWIGMREGDVDADGAPDWMVLVHTQAAPKYLDLWAILRRDNTLVPMLIETRFSRTVYSTFAWRAYQPSASAGMVNVYLVRDKMTLFRITTDNSQPQLTYLPVPDVEKNRKFDSTAAFDVRKGNGPYPSYDLVVQRTSGQTQTYTWDEAAVQFAINTGPLTQADRLRAAGDLLFGPQPDPVKARTQIEDLLRDRLDEPVPSTRSTDKFAPRIRPYLQYLLGLTYELTNQPDIAARTYYQLWREYPDNPYAVIARMKLEIK